MTNSKATKCSNDKQTWKPFYVVQHCAEISSNLSKHSWRLTQIQVVDIEKSVWNTKMLQLTFLKDRYLFFGGAISATRRMILISNKIYIKNFKQKTMSWLHFMDACVWMATISTHSVQRLSNDNALCCYIHPGVFVPIHSFMPILCASNSFYLKWTIST